jgi:hypothetical protein
LDVAYRKKKVLKKKKKKPPPLFSLEFIMDLKKTYWGFLAKQNKMGA